MRAAQALDVHAAMAEEVRRETTREYLNALAGEQQRVRGSVGPVVANHLQAAYTFHVDAKIIGLVEARAAALNEKATFGEFPPPTPCGIIVLDEPLVTKEARGRDEHADVITWGPAAFTLDPAEGSVGSPKNALQRYGTLVVLWNDLHRPDDVSKAMAEELGQGAVEDFMDRLGGHYIPTQMIPTTNDMWVGPSVLPVSARDIKRITADGDTPTEAESPLRRVLALWELMNETVTVFRDESKFPNKARRRAAKLRITPRVTVVTLRRTSDSAETGTGRPLDHQVLVRPYRKRVWVGSGADRHQEWRDIAQHVRGPEGTPLVITDKVYDLKR